MVDNITPEDKNIMNTTNYKVEFNFEFLDDYRDVPFKERWMKRIPCCFPKADDGDDELYKNYAFSDITSAVDDSGGEDANSKNTVATWGPPGFSPLTHPLQLMVRACKGCHAVQIIAFHSYNVQCNCRCYRGMWSIPMCLLCNVIIP